MLKRHEFLLTAGIHEPPSSQHFVNRTIDTRAIKPPLVEMGEAALALPALVVLDAALVVLPLALVVVGFFVVVLFAACASELRNAIATKATKRKKAANGDMAFLF